MLPTELTVSAVVENDGRFLLVEDKSSGVTSLNQPGGRIETDEAPEDAVIREAREVARCQIAVSGFFGVYLWIHPQTRQQFLRLVYTADLLGEDETQNRNSVYAVHWYSIGELMHRKRDCRSPIVIRCVEDYLAGARQPESLLAGMHPVQQNVAAVMANARLV